MDMNTKKTTDLPTDVPMDSQLYVQGKKETTILLTNNDNL